MDIAIDPTTDPSQSGLIGIDYSDLTTTLGDLRAKQLSVQPAFAALIVTWLKDAGVRRGDRVALSLTGSFPGLNIAALSACEAMGLEALVIVDWRVELWRQYPRLHMAGYGALPGRAGACPFTYALCLLRWNCGHRRWARWAGLRTSRTRD
ncbi:MAG: poly-gamma-glutamate system protein [Betaproteobacteria bacterium]|nr:poly-gamma-glutamate system protein [Betaproteobacteria bacterium]